MDDFITLLGAVEGIIYNSSMNMKPNEQSMQVSYVEQRFDKD